MALTAPTFSIVTPNYNHGRYLEQCVQSIAKQRVPAFEQIVVDDGSTDDSREVLRDLEVRFPFLRAIFLGRNQGAHIAMKRGILEATGQFIVFLGADDILLPNAIDRYSAVLRAHPDASLICGEVEFRSETTSWHRRYVTAKEPTYLGPEQLTYFHRSMLAVVNGSAAVSRDEILHSILGDVELAWHADLFVYTVLGYRKGVWYVPEVVHQFRVTGKNLSAKAGIWKLQRPVLAHIFALLASPQFSDVRDLFRRGAALASLPLILRYMAYHPSTWHFLTFRLVFNGAVLATYRIVRRLVPRTLVHRYIDLSSRLFAKHRTKSKITA